MSDQQELRERREALAQAVNSHDKEAVLAFIHPTFVGKSKRGWTLARYQGVVRMMEHLFAPGTDYQETVAIEEIEVSGDSARLLVRRVARAGSRSQEDRVQETWRLIDGRWLLMEERRRDAILKTRHLLVAVAVVVAVGAYFAWGVFTDFAGPGRAGTEFQRSGDPALKLEVRRASTKEVDSWKPSITPDYPPGGNATYYVSPEVELSNEDVLSTRVYPYQKAVSRRRGGDLFLVFSVAFFVAWWRDKKWWWGVSGGVFLLLGLGLTSTVSRFDQHGFWHVVIRFDDAGTKKLADLTTSMMEGRSEQTKSSPSNHLAFLIDGELHLVAPVWKKHTEGPYTIPEGGLSKEFATRFAKGIVSE